MGQSCGGSLEVVGTGGSVVFRSGGIRSGVGVSRTRVGGARSWGSGAAIVVVRGVGRVCSWFGLFGLLLLSGLLTLTLPMAGIEVLSGVLHVLVGVRFVAECGNWVFDAGRKTLVVVAFKNGIGIVEFDSVSIELRVVSDNLPIILHLNVLNGFFRISYGVNVAVISSENLEELEVVVGPLRILIELIGIYKPGLEPFDGWPLEITKSKVNFLVILLVLLRKILEVQFALEDKRRKLSGVQAIKGLRLLGFGLRSGL